MPEKPISKMTPSERETLVKRVIDVIRGDYYTEVGEYAKELIEEAKDAYKDGELDSEWVIERLDETIDGAQRVIYTFKAQLGLLVSDNDGAYMDDFGSEGVAQDGVINWSALMYSAMRQDVLDELDREGFDVNDPEEYFEDEEESGVTIDHEKYGEKTGFSSLEEAQRVIRSMGGDFRRTKFSVKGRKVVDEDSDIVGEVED